MTADTLPRKLYELNRTVAVHTAEWASSAAKTVGASAARVVEASRNAGATVVGQTRSVLERTTTTARDGAREIAGQAEAQGANVASHADREAHRLVDRASDAVEDAPAPGTPYEDWTREQLYRRAQELGIEGRASMSKAELVKALRR